MKSNVKFILSAAAALLLLSCARELPVSEALPAAGEQAPSSSQKEVVWNINVSNGGDTKGIKSGWEEGDVVYVFFKDLINAGDGKSAYLELKYENSRWSFTPKNGLDYNSITSGLNASALYFPYGNDMTLSWDDTDGVVFSNETATSSGFLYATSSVTVEQGGEFSTIGANFIMQPNANIVRFFIPDENAEGVAELKGNALKPYNVKVSNSGISFSETSSNYGDSVPGFAATISGEKGWYFYGQANKIGTLFFHIKLPDDSRYTLYRTRNAIESGKSYTMPSLNDWQPAGNDKYVKLGGNYWCTYNAVGSDNGTTQAPDCFSASLYVWGEYYNGIRTDQKVPSEAEWRRMIGDCNSGPITIKADRFMVYTYRNNKNTHLIFRCNLDGQTGDDFFYHSSTLSYDVNYSKVFWTNNRGMYARPVNRLFGVKPILDTLGNKPIYNPPVSGEENF